MTKKIKSIIEKEVYDINDLITIMKILRSDGGCPWDREQTHESIRKNLIEETYEVVEAIDLQDSSLMREELGDLLLQVVFHARIEEEAGKFDFADVSNDICKKLIHRHPHIFANVTADSAEQVLINWDKIKQKEKNQKNLGDELNSVSKALPSLVRASKIAKKANKHGLKTAAEDDLDKFSNTDENDAEIVLGEELMRLCAICAKLDVDPEQALYKTCDRYILQVEKMEKK